MNEEEVELLTGEERAILVQIAAAEPPEGQRAQALLAAADGASLEQAGAQANLTPNQVRYWLGRFRSQRLSIFPQEMVTAVTEMGIPVEPANAGIGAEVPLEKEPKKKKSGSKKKKAKKKKSKSKKKDKPKSKQKATDDEEKKAEKVGKKKKDRKKSGGKNKKGKKNKKDEKAKKSKSKKKKVKKKK